MLCDNCGKGNLTKWSGEPPSANGGLQMINTEYYCDNPCCGHYHDPEGSVELSKRSWLTRQEFYDGTTQLTLDEYLERYS